MTLMIDKSIFIELQTYINKVKWSSENKKNIIKCLEEYVVFNNQELKSMNEK
jgi:hypothetical protein